MRVRGWSVRYVQVITLGFALVWFITLIGLVTWAPDDVGTDAPVAVWLGAVVTVVGAVVIVGLATASILTFRAYEADRAAAARSASLDDRVRAWRDGTPASVPTVEVPRLQRLADRWGFVAGTGMLLGFGLVVGRPFLVLIDDAERAPWHLDRLAALADPVGTIAAVVLVLSLPTIALAIVAQIISLLQARSAS